MKIPKLLSSLLAAVLAATAFADIKINSSIKNGDKLTGVVEIRVTVVSDSPINQVEFYVNDELRSTDTSTPYTFTIDTVLEKEGPLTLEIAAFAANGDSKRIKLNLLVDNEVGKGAKYHTDNAIKFLQVSKFDEAIRACRIALKANENYVPAKITMARAFLGKGILDEAEKWAEDAYLSEESVDTAELLSGIHVERAFRTISISGEKGDALKIIATSLKNAVIYKRKANELRLKALGKLTEENRLAMVDLYIANNEYSAARRLLREKWNDFKPDNAIGNRLVFVEMRSGRMKEAWEILKALETRGTPDEVTYALFAAGYAYYRNYDKASEALRNAVLAGTESPIVTTAAAYLAVRKGDLNAIGSQINDMLRKNITDPEVYFYLSVLQYYNGNYAESRENFKKTVIQNPLLFDAYIQRGYEALASALAKGVEAKDKEILLEQARVYMEIALEAKPDAAEALNGLAIMNMFLNKNEEALRYAEAATRAGGQYPWTWFTYSAALDLNKKSVEAQNAVDKAGELDFVVLKGRAIPSKEEAWIYTFRNGRIPTLIAPK